jgi:hypothetical protein
MEAEEKSKYHEDYKTHADDRICQTLCNKNTHLATRATRAPPHRACAARTCDNKKNITKTGFATA